MENKPKNLKKVEQGKKLAARNKERFEEWKKMKEELRKHEEKEGLTTFKELSTFKEEEKPSTNLLILPVIIVSVVVVGVL